MEELNKKEIEEKQENEKQENENSEQRENLKIKIGTVGNFVLIAFIILIIGTGALTYYLIHSAKDDYDKQYSEIVSNLAATENVVENNEAEEDEEETETETVANIIDSAISEATTGSATTTDEGAKKLMNESLVVLYNGLILDTSKMDEVTLQ